MQRDRHNVPNARSKESRQTFTRQSVERQRGRPRCKRLTADITVERPDVWWERTPTVVVISRIITGIRTTWLWWRIVRFLHTQKPTPVADSGRWAEAVAYIPGGRRLRPVKNRGGGSFDKVADQNFPPPIFTGQTTPLTKLFPPIFYFCRPMCQMLLLSPNFWLVKTNLMNLISQSLSDFTLVLFCFLRQWYDSAETYSLSRRTAVLSMLIPRYNLASCFTENMHSAWQY